jgi:hypothetical protein
MGAAREVGAVTPLRLLALGLSVARAALRFIAPRRSPLPARDAARQSAAMRGAGPDGCTHPVRWADREGWRCAACDRVVGP